MLELKKKILEIIQKEGPVLPIQISRKLSSNTIFAGAILSELFANKLILISSAKVGGSPLYYVKGQEEKLDQLFPYLKDKEKEAYNLLKSNQIVKDREQEPGIRVALREIKDFAIAYKKGEELYWRWYLTSESEVQNILSTGDTVQGLIINKPLEIPQTPLLKEPEINKEIPKKVPIIKKSELEKDEFLEKVIQFIQENNLIKEDQQTIKRKKEYEFTVKVNSELGYLNFFLKAINKKKLSEKEIETIFESTRQRGLPLILVTPGDQSKRTSKYKELIHNFILK